MNFIFRSATIKKIVEYGDRLYYFSDAGLDVIDLVNKTSLGYVTLANVTCGAVNDNGVYLGTTAAGVYFISHANVLLGGNQTANVTLKYSTATTPALPTSNVINDMEGAASALIIATGYGVCYLPGPTALYKCPVTGGSKKVALSGSRIIWENAAVAYYAETPLMDWSVGRAIADGTVPSGVAPTSSNLVSQSSLYSDEINTGTNSRTTINGQHFFFSGGHGPNCVKLNTSTLAPTRVPFVPAQPLGSATGYTYLYSGVAGNSAGYCVVTCDTGANAIAFYKYDSGANQWNQLSFTPGGPNLSVVGSAIWVGDYLVILGYSTVSNNWVLQLYVRAGDTLTYLGTPVTGLVAWQGANNNQGTPLTLLTGTDLLIYHGGRATNATIFRVKNDTIAATQTFGTSGWGMENQQSSRLSISELSSTNHFAITFSFNDGYQRRCFNVMKLNPVAGTVTCVAVPSSYQVGGGGYGEYMSTGQREGARCAMHPSGRYIIELINGSYTVRYFDPVSQTLTGQGYLAVPSAATISPITWLHFLDDTHVIVGASSNSTTSEITVSKFNYGTKPAGITGITVVNDIAGSSEGSAFVATDVGVLCYDALRDQYLALAGVFGVTNNVKSLCPSPEARVGHGVLAYGTSNGSNKGQMGVLSLRTLRTLATQLGDQDQIWSSGFDVMAYGSHIDWLEDRSPATRKIILLGDSVKDIARHGGYLYHFTEAGVDITRLSDSVRICWATVAGVICGAVNDNGIYFGTSLGVKRLRHADIVIGIDVGSSVVTAYSTTTTPALQSNSVVDLDASGTVLAVASSAGVDFLPTESTVFRRTVATATAVAIDATRFAYAEGGKSYHSGHPAANWTLADMTESTGVTGTVINAQKFGLDLFIGTNDGISVHNTSTHATKNVSTDLGLVRNVVSLSPTSMAQAASGLVAYGISNGDGTGKFGVLDMGTV